jgi:hypothetical protein
MVNGSKQGAWMKSYAQADDRAGLFGYIPRNLTIILPDQRMKKRPSSEGRRKGDAAEGVKGVKRA